MAMNEDRVLEALESLRGYIDFSLAGLESRLIARFERLEGRMTSLEARMAGLEGRMASLEYHGSSVERRVTILEGR